MFKSLAKFLLGVSAMCCWLGMAHAQVSQAPMLTRGSAVPPNVVFAFDDSGSMAGTYMYQFGINPDGFGMHLTNEATASQSPDINLMYYDPRKVYKRRVNADGTSMAAGTTTATSFVVNFYTGTQPYTDALASSAANYASPTFTPSAGTTITGSTATYPVTVNSAAAPFPKFLNRTDCAAVTFCTWAEELQNYANWQTYHSTRVRLARTGIGLAFKDFGASFRLGWGTINTLESSNALRSGVSLFNATTKAEFYDWLYNNSDTNPSGDTPNRKAIDNVGKYFKRSDNDGPWGDTPSKTSTGVTNTGTANSNHLACRRSNVLLMTDGYWNGSAGSDIDHEDGTNGPSILHPKGSTYTYTYTAVEPYKDGTANTLADTAMRYWKTDLRGDLTNTVAITPEDPAFWQHMTFYGIGLGVYGTLPQTTLTLARLTAGTLTWPAAQESDPTAIDDMWHAAVNSRGQFLNAGDSDSLSRSIASIFEQINRVPSTQSGVAISTANLTAGTRKYTPRYETGSWTGNVIARNLNADTGTEISTAWQVVGTSTTGGTTVTFNGIPGYASRNIVAWNGSSAEAFTNTSSITNSMTSTVSANLINYLRGDQSNEGSNGLKLYRPREVLLGDIVNSAPAFVKGGIDLSYELLPLSDTDKAAYRTHVNTKKARSEGAVFVGANAGMLHAFRDGTTATVALSGQEVFAYIPRAVLPNLHLLADKNYTHRYFVDGPNVETDALFGSGTWKNLLVGTTGAGAKAVYALDVTNPIAMTAASVLWEISPSTNASFAQMGHVLSDVQMGRTPSGDWVAIFGNGYDSAAGFARLYIVNLLDGTYIKDIAVGVAGGNGLGAVRLVRDDKQQVIGAYAGDLKGKMWKFDLSGASSASWQVGLNGLPLYDAGTTKPITARPVVIPNPTGGSVVAFATGKLFEDSDLDTLTTQTVYGVLDDIPFGSPTSVMTAVVQSNLVQQTIGEGKILTVTFTASDLTLSSKTIMTYPISRNTVTFSASVRGWFVNLTQDGQRTVYPLDLLANRFVAVDTISPVGVNTSNACLQGASGSGLLYFIDGLTGGGVPEPIIDTDGNGFINALDGTISGISSVADGRNLVAPVDSKTSGTQIGYVVCSGGAANCTEVRIPCSLSDSCPATNVRSREWRQLFMR